MPPTKDQIAELGLRFKSQSDLYAFMSIVCTKLVQFDFFSGLASAHKVVMQARIFTADC